MYNRKTAYTIRISLSYILPLKQFRIDGRNGKWYIRTYISTVRLDYENFAAMNERVQAANSPNVSNPLGSEGGSPR